MSREKEPEDRPRREKENMDEPQEEFIDISSVPSHTKEEEEEKAKKPVRPGDVIWPCIRTRLGRLRSLLR